MMLGKAKQSSTRESQSDSMLMLAWRAGDLEAFELIYNRYKEGLLSYFVRNTNDQARANELFQDVWMSVIQGREKYQDSAPFGGWLYRIAHNRLIDHFRYLKCHTKDDHFSHEVVSRIETPLQPHEIASASQDRDRLNEAIQQLPIAQRNVFVMRMELRLSLTEIAVISGEPRETVKSRLRYACNKMRDYLRSMP